MTSKRENIYVRFVELDDSFVTYEDRLNHLVSTTLGYPNSLIVASEVYLSGFDYDNMEKASNFSQMAIEKLIEIAENQIIILTVIRKIDNAFVNQAIVIHNHKIVHTQEKSKLFKLGGEDRYFVSGQDNKIKPFEINGIKIGILICFELRFKELWKVLEGCDIIAVPSKWGVLRELHFRVLSNALAVMNQCFVVAHSSGGKDIVNSSMIYSPNGNLVDNIDIAEVAKMKRYIAVGWGC
ncbi:Nitrilase/cyanide hydratase and apolipoprotein N-acyltransferase [Sulfurovum sp. enrichment culture clone C5]|uniref:Nitrilase/cyanide hydratase and apolipoprotein N-acyltransferase n=1 Tax=Sulfurovum sp. enrichment culture clone C5 TaxID=497650 RepID=A0A0S4XP78_9BACT|nr:Nitrilase/cyanide hydratase and apolipoprotein N-acyltransferase [Sulfurovum sp. enrichment culture clone C5]